MQGPPNVQTMPLEVEQAELSDNTPDLISYLRFGEGAKLFGVPPGKEMVIGAWCVGSQVVVSGSAPGFWQVESNDL